nr:S-layer homology domain-containing protein [Fredinandcohnia sp. SECRCQ15]
MRSNNFGFYEINDFIASDSIDGFVDTKSGKLSFKPNDKVTRAQFAKLLLSAMGITPQKVDQKFSDVSPNKWYADYINTAQKLDIISGYKDGKFKPSENITRGQIAAMIVRAFDKTVDFPETSIQQFPDVSSKTTFAKEINQAASLKIISGYGDGQFKSANLATRSQAVVMIYRALSDEKPSKASNQVVENVVMNYVDDVESTFTSTGIETPPLTKVYNKYGSEYFNLFSLQRVENTKNQIQHNSKLLLKDSERKTNVLFLSDRYAEILVSNASTPEITTNDGKVVKLENLNANGLYFLKNTANGWKIYNYSAASDGISSPRTNKSSNVENNTTLKDIISKEKSVVTLVSYDDFGQPVSQGSGFIVSDRLIASNYHVVEGSKRVEAILQSGEEIEIEGIVEYDVDSDLVLLKSKSVLKETPLKLGSYQMVEKGDSVVAIGNPEGLTNTVSNGIVSGLRDFMINNKTYHLIQFTAPITFGSSGGPLFNMDGYVVGLTSMGYDSGNLNFAIAIDGVKNWLQKYQSVAGNNIPVKNPEQSDSSENNNSPSDQEYTISNIDSLRISGIDMADSLIDPNKPYIYMIDKTSRELLIINYVNKEKSIVPLNYEPSGLSLSEDGRKLFIVNRKTKFLLSIYNLEKNEMETHLEYEILDYTHDDNVHRHVYERDNKIFVVIGTWAPKLIAFNAVTYQPIEIPNIEGVGSMVFSNDNKHFYYWYQYGWSAGWAASYIMKYSIDGNNLIEDGRADVDYPYLTRDPLDSPIILLEDKNLLISKACIFDSGDLSLLNIFPEPIYAASSDLNIVVGKNGAYRLHNTLKVEAKAFNFTGYDIQKMDFKQNELLIFNKQGSDIVIQRIKIVKK